MNDIYISDFIKYLMLDLNYSDNTIVSYEYEIRRFIDYYEKKNIISLTSKDIEKYLSTLSELAPASISHSISVIKSFYLYLTKVGHIKISPCDAIKQPKLGLHLPVYLTEEEINKLLDIDIQNAFDARNKAILELMYATGLRISEVVNLEFNNIDFEDCIVRIVGKGNKERIVPINDYALDAINNYINNYRDSLLIKGIRSQIFLNNHGEILTRQGIFKMIKQECLKKGIDKNVGPHTIRHTFATHLLQNGADLRIIQELLGHSDISTTQIYTHLTNEKLKQDYLKYHPRS